MAWIAFAAPYLAVLGTIYRTYDPSRRGAAILGGAVLLLVISLVSALGYREIRALRAAFSAPTWGDRTVGCAPLAILFALGVPMLVLIGQLLIVMFDLDAYWWASNSAP
jgi:uncharacterized iron-regulated membrane protein